MQRYQLRYLLAIFIFDVLYKTVFIYLKFKVGLMEKVTVTRNFQITIPASISN